MAKIWNRSPSMLRTQQGMVAVSPSDGVTTGFRYVAKRVWPAGNFSTRPSDTHARLPGLRPRETGENR